MWYIGNVVYRLFCCVSAAVANRKAYAAYRRAQDKFTTGVQLLESRKAKADKAASQREKGLAEVGAVLKAADDAFYNALAVVAANYNEKVAVVQDLWVLHARSEEPIVEEEEENERVQEPIEEEEDDYEENERVQIVEEEEEDDYEENERVQEPPLQQAQDEEAIENLSRLLVMPEDEDIKHAAAPPGQKLRPIRRSKSSASTAAAAPKAPQTSTAPAPTPPPATVTPPASVPLSTPASVAPSENVYGYAASNVVAGNNLEGAVQQILDMGGGTWDRDTVVRALRAAFNNPERAVDYLYSGIPEAAEVPPVAGVPLVPAVNPPVQAPQTTQPAAAPPSGPNADPLNLFPLGLPDMGGNAPAGAGAGGNLDFLRNTPRFQAKSTNLRKR